MKYNFKYIYNNLPTFIKEYKQFLLDDKGIQLEKVDVVSYISRFDSKELQKATLKKMFDTSKEYLSREAKKEVQELLK